MRFTTWIMIVLLALPLSEAYAQSKGKTWGSGIDFTKKAAAKGRTRWSLTEWLEMKERNRLMDQWLNLESPSPFEFYLGVSYKSFSSENVIASTKESYTDFAGEFSAYAQIFGVTAEYEDNNKENYKDLSGMFNFRLLGDSNQNTNLTLSFGQRTRTISSPTSVDLVQQFGQGRLDLYITKYVGLEGIYRYYLKKDEAVVGNEINETLTEAGLFIDFSALRIFGSWYQEDQKSKNANTLADQEQKRTGIKSGIKLFF